MKLDCFLFLTGFDKEYEYLVCSGASAGLSVALGVLTEVAFDETSPYYRYLLHPSVITAY